MCPVLGGEKRVVNQWLAPAPLYIGMLLKMICKFNDLPGEHKAAMASG